LIFLDESGFMLQPLRRDTWAPIGEVPVRYAWDRHDRISAICALTLAPWADRFGLYYDLRAGNISTPDVMKMIKSVHQHIRRELIVVLDRWSVHRSAVKQLQYAGCTWLTASWLPAYAPEIDPVEFVWNRAKYIDLVNWIPENITDVRDHLIEVFEKYRKNPECLASFFHIAKLL
jgi:hypothetical protein